MSETLTWKVQHASYHPQEGGGLLHVARSQHGIFEIFEDGPHYLLHAPTSMKLPAELFGSLSAAKAHADSLIPTPSPPIGAGRMNPRETKERAGE